MSPADPPPQLSLTRAVALGLLHGPAELLPVSSSAHVGLVPWLLGRPSRLGPGEQKALEVALHAGSGAGLLLILARECPGRGLGRPGRRGRAQLVALAATVGPPAAAGLLLQGPIERRLGTPAATAGGLLAGSVALVWADRAPGRRAAPEAGAVDALWLGLAQACALSPGVSRLGATLCAARARGFAPEQAGTLARGSALPVIAAAASLQAVQAARGGLGPGLARGLAAGAAAALLSTLAAARLWPPARRDRALWPYALYRAGLALLVVRRLREDGG